MPANERIVRYDAEGMLMLEENADAIAARLDEINEASPPARDGGTTGGAPAGAGLFLLALVSCLRRTRLSPAR